MLYGKSWHPVSKLFFTDVTLCRLIVIILREYNIPHFTGEETEDQKLNNPSPGDLKDSGISIMPQYFTIISNYL